MTVSIPQDSEGKRYGKVIDYNVSELRAVELLENLCETMAKYDLLWLDDTEGWRWVKKRGEGAVDAVSKREVPFNNTGSDARAFAHTAPLKKHTDGSGGAAIEAKRP